MKRQARLRDKSGAELVELAVVMPLLLMLIAGIVDFGFLLQSFEVVSNATREGARVGVLPGYKTADIQGRVASYITAAGLTGTPTTTVTSVTVDPGGGGAPFPAVQVSVSYAYQFLFIKPMVTLIGGSFAASKTFTTTAVMRSEVAP
jgi:Flp pilus assembly protein TadG